MASLLFSVVSVKYFCSTLPQNNLHARDWTTEQNNIPLRRSTLNKKTLKSGEKKGRRASIFLEILHAWKYQTTIWLGKKYVGGECFTFCEDLATVFHHLIDINIAKKKSRPFITVWFFFLGLDSWYLKSSNFIKLCLCVEFANFIPPPQNNWAHFKLWIYVSLIWGNIYSIWILVLFLLLETPFVRKLKFLSCLPYLSFWGG